MSDKAKLPIVEVGKSYRVDYGKKNPNNKVLHIRAIVDGDQVVARQWSKGRQEWAYRVDDMITYEVWKRNGDLFLRPDR